MARQHAGDSQEMYRVVLTLTYLQEGEEPRVITSTFGPYNDLGTAKARITSAKNTAYAVTVGSGRESTRHLTYGRPWAERTVEGHVEKATVVWEVVS